MARICVTSSKEEEENGRSKQKIKTSHLTVQGKIIFFLQICEGCFINVNVNNYEWHQRRLTYYYNPIIQNVLKHIFTLTKIHFVNK
jgi:hypothetical protein